MKRIFFFMIAVLLVAGCSDKEKAPVITVTATGLNDLQVGQAVSGASVVYTLTNGTYADPIEPSNFAVTNLPDGLTAGTATRINGTVVTVSITGTPTAVGAGTPTITLPASIPANQVEGASSAITPTESVITVNAVAKGEGAAVSIPIAGRMKPSSSRITMQSVILTPENGQEAEYAITTSESTTAPTGDWQIVPIFHELTAATTYYVWARSEANDDYNAGEAKRSVGITTRAAAAPTVTVGEKIGSLPAAPATGTIAYQVSTARIDDGEVGTITWYRKSGKGRITEMANAPTGITTATVSAVSDNTAIVTIIGSQPTMTALTSYHFIVTIADADSDMVDL